jgi:hypothetical protein
MRKPVFAFAACTAWLVLAASVPVAAQSASVSAVRAAFVYNFAKFTQWPPDAMSKAAPVVVCVMDDPGVADALEELAKGRTVGDHALAVRRTQPQDSLRPCSLLYASRLNAKRAIELVEMLKHSAVLTISDYGEFAQLGGMANFFFDNGKIRFEVNVQSIQRARLQVSSKLLTLGRIVRESDAQPH